jgi:hypothetical protein
MNEAKPVRLNVGVPHEVHRKAKAAAALVRMTWDEAVAEALEQWARSKGVTGTGVRR